MSEVERRTRYDDRRVLIETERVLASQFRSTLLSLTGAQIELLRNVVAYLNRASTFVTVYAGTYYLTPTACEWDSLQSIVADLEETLMGIIFQDDYVCVRDKKAQGAQGGAFPSGAWRTRNINDEQADDAGICSIESNQITLVAGTYRCAMSAPAYQVGLHQVRLWSVTDSLALLEGTSAYGGAEDTVVTRSFAVGRFVLAGAKVLEVQHRCSATRDGVGLGVACNFTAEIYSVAEFWRKAIP